MTATTHDPRTTGLTGGVGAVHLGPIWRDSNVRTGPSLQHPVIELLLPDGVTHFGAVRWVRGEEVVEGVIVSDIWFELTPDRWCSAVNFVQTTIDEVLLGGAQPVRRDGGAAAGALVGTGSTGPAQREDGDPT